MMGIFPTTYVEIVPSDAVVNLYNIHFILMLIFSLSGNYSYKEREKLRWPSKSKIQFHRTNPNGALIDKR